jgi:large subunit ribosomal protein L6
MSRVGKQPIEIPTGVTVTYKDNEVHVKGNKGELKQYINNDKIEVKIDGNILSVNRATEEKKVRAMHGLYQRLIRNMVIGVSEGYKKVLLINGTGYRANMQGNNLNLQLGYSHPIEFPIPKEINCSVEGNNRITLESFDKQLLGQIAANIRELRPPEPYKGKGIRYENENVKRKAGKTGV